MFLDSSFLNIDSGFQPAAGRLLIAQPFMNEPYFGRSVVLLSQHSEKGVWDWCLTSRLNCFFTK